MENKNVLITGGTGLVGNRMAQLLLAKGYSVRFLSRAEDLQSQIKKYKWDPTTGFIDKAALENVATIIHLAGAGVAEKRWTTTRKKEILDSRINSTELLFVTLKNTKNHVKTIISASAIGFYGFSNTDKLYHETDKVGTDFLAKVTNAWENETEKFTQLGLRVAKLRIGVVLSEKGGALPQMVMPIKYFAGAAIGSGQQMISWIALDDLCNLFIYCIENEKVRGVYNAVAPKPVTNQSFTKTIGKIIKRPIWPINIPAFLLKIVLGEMAVIVTESNAVSNQRIATETEFTYQFTELEPCLQQLLGN